MIVIKLLLRFRTNKLTFKKGFQREVNKKYLNNKTKRILFKEILFRQKLIKYLHKKPLLIIKNN